MERLRGGGDRVPTLWVVIYGFLVMGVKGGLPVFPRKTSCSFLTINTYSYHHKNISCNLIVFVFYLW